MTHQEVTDFIIEVFESGIYSTNNLGGFVITEFSGYHVMEREEDTTW